MRIPMSVMLQQAKKGKYGCPAPNVFSWDDVKTCFELSVQYRAPIVIDMAPIPPLMEPIAKAVAYYDTKYPNAVVTLNLDHGDTWENIMLALRYGFDSVMIDRSMCELEQNIRETAEVVKVAHAMGVSVEAELGRVGYNANYALCAEEASAYTDPGEAQHFVQATGVDCLAVSVGTSHGVYSGGIPHLEFQLLSRLSGELEIPLVLHGGSSTGDENLKKAVELGIQKVNLCSDLCNAGYDAMQAACAKITNRRPMPPEIYDPMTAGYREMLEHYLKLFGGIGALDQKDC